jgi:KUP system potassium uptake protein
LFGLFVVQSRGTAKVAAFFGPVMVSVARFAGALHISDDPGVLMAINPFTVRSLRTRQIGLVTLGAIFLVTGGEALYGPWAFRPPIQSMAVGIAGALINYFGQGALVLANPAAIANPFYRWCRRPTLPMVVLATATVIAPGGDYRRLFAGPPGDSTGFLPRLAIQHTSASHVGQIYIPRVTVALLIGVLLLVGLFRRRARWRQAWQNVVATTMVVDGLLAFIVVGSWHWPL